MATIRFTNHNVSLVLKDKLLLRTFLASIFSQEGRSFEAISYIFCSDEYLLQMNIEYLKHNTYTDILTFTLSETSLPIISDIYISVERVSENASKLSIPFETELRRVMIHGVLHLCGYEDHTPELRKAMRDREDYYLAQY